MSNESPTPAPEKRDRLGTWIAILIAAISVLAALGAWRVAVATSAAADADTLGLLASVEREDALTGAYITAYGRYGAYARAVGYDALAKLLEPIEAAATDATVKARLTRERDNLIYGALQLRGALPQRYVDRELNYDIDRDIGEAVADRALERDTNAPPHFDRGTAARAKAQWLLGLLVLLAAAFVLLTFADAIKHPLRILFVLLAVVVLAVAVFAGLGIELFGAPLLS